MTPRLRRAALWSTIALAIALALVFAFRPQPVGVDTVTVKRGELLVTVDEEGKTRVHDVYVLSAPVAGRMHRVGVHPGDPVTALKTVVAEIEPIAPAFLDLRGAAQARADVRAAESAQALAKAQVEQARAELDFAQRNYERVSALTTQGVSSQHDVDVAERAFRTSRAALATALAGLEVRAFDLERARAQLVSPADAAKEEGVCACVSLRAPVDGRVLQVLQQSESVVPAGASLVEIGDPRDLEIVVELLTTDAVKVHPGQHVIIDDWGGDAPLAGQVRVVEPYGFTKVSALGIEEQRVNAIVDITSPREKWAQLAHGYQVEARIVIADEKNVLTLPLTALFRDGSKWAVFVDADNRARIRHVTLGQRTDTEAEITSGITQGERVVLHPSDRVADGVRISTRGTM